MDSPAAKPVKSRTTLKKIGSDGLPIETHVPTRHPEYEVGKDGINPVTPNNPPAKA